MRFPILLINLKLYKEGLNPEIPHIIRNVSKETGIEIILCPPHTLISEYSKTVPVFSQSMDPMKQGAYTGYVIAEHIKHAGATGAFLNHTEKKMQLNDIKTAIERCKELSLLSCVYTADNEIKEITDMNPDMMLLEPAELNSENISISTADPDIINRTMKSKLNLIKDISPKTKVLYGAGIKSGLDVRKAIELGADGIGIGSKIVKAPDIEKALREFVSGFGCSYSRSMK